MATDQQHSPIPIAYMHTYICIPQLNFLAHQGQFKAWQQFFISFPVIHTNVCICSHTCIHTYTHTYICMYVCMFVAKLLSQKPYFAVVFVAVINEHEHLMFGTSSINSFIFFCFYYYYFLFVCFCFVLSVCSTFFNALAPLIIYANLQLCCNLCAQFTLAGYLAERVTCQQQQQQRAKVQAPKKKEKRKLSSVSECAALVVVVVVAWLCFVLVCFGLFYCFIARPFVYLHFRGQ